MLTSVIYLRSWFMAAMQLVLGLTLIVNIIVFVNWYYWKVNFMLLMAWAWCLTNCVNDGSVPVSSFRTLHVFGTCVIIVLMTKKRKYINHHSEGEYTFGQKSSVHYKISQLSMEEQMFLLSSHNPCIEIIIYACKFYDSAALENGCHTLLELDSNSPTNWLRTTYLSTVVI